eukprot:CAMPEP_0184297942 /NCGR_PEP_ID=MMETSP1049-20130417/8808_1 /TAXON_ID=77928 /ORGANISM="Proteomonas sulcata, Strain CCMP704" /LENGTH=519 /DNA_ID=CAMNT_0026607899 /DNA_START=117 /DNA_END=1677 /DNA_ORIENTATION=+
MSQATSDASVRGPEWRSGESSRIDSSMRGSRDGPFSVHPSIVLGSRLSPAGGESSSTSSGAHRLSAVEQIGPSLLFGLPPPVAAFPGGGQFNLGGGHGVFSILDPTTSRSRRGGGRLNTSITSELPDAPVPNSAERNNRGSNRDRERSDRYFRGFLQRRSGTSNQSSSGRSETTESTSSTSSQTSREPRESTQQHPLQQFLQRAFSQLSAEVVVTDLVRRALEANRYRGNPPASQYAIDNLSEATINEPFEEGCPICQDEMSVGGISLSMPCGHSFHRDCLLPWLAEHNTCPVCRCEVESHCPRYNQANYGKLKGMLAKETVSNHEKASQPNADGASLGAESVDGAGQGPPFLNGFGERDSPFGNGVPARSFRMTFRMPAGAFTSLHPHPQGPGGPPSETQESRAREQFLTQQREQHQQQLRRQLRAQQQQQQAAEIRRRTRDQLMGRPQSERRQSTERSDPDASDGSARATSTGKRSTREGKTPAAKKTNKVVDEEEDQASKISHRRDQKKSPQGAPK